MPAATRRSRGESTKHGTSSGTRIGAPLTTGRAQEPEPPLAHRAARHRADRPLEQAPEVSLATTCRRHGGGHGLCHLVGVAQPRRSAAEGSAANSRPRSPASSCSAATSSDVLVGRGAAINVKTGTHATAEVSVYVHQTGTESGDVFRTYEVLMSFRRENNRWRFEAYAPLD